MQYKPRCSGCCLQPGCIGAVFFPTGVGEVKPEGFSAVHSGRVRKRSRFLYLMIHQESRKFFCFLFGLYLRRVLFFLFVAFPF